MTLQAPDIAVIRQVLANLDPKSSASAASPLPKDELYAPPAHAVALDPDRSLVVGNRGAGKSVWSGVLADEPTRLAVSPSYPSLHLDRLVVQLGFHEDAGRVEGVAPSPKVLASLLTQGIDPESIWTAVLLRAIGPLAHINIPDTLSDTLEWSLSHIEQAEAALRQADKHFAQNGLEFLLVFDALDRLASRWEIIRPLTSGILRLALGMRGYGNMRAKVFMRTDQAKDEAVFQFPDASKLQASRVELSWHATELYGLLFGIIARNANSAEAFSRMIVAAFGGKRNSLTITEPTDQIKVFSLIAGEFMGLDHRRGRTYTWVVDHLADAFHETTPRSFLVTLQRAANSRTKPKNTVVDYHGIREGVQGASEIRVNQLQEDYPWIRTVLEDLAGLEVPCTPGVFTKRWREKKTVEATALIAGKSERPGPIELEGIAGFSKEASLLEALKNVGVVEERSADRINMPDLFRVAAKIKRRGGVRPPSSGLRRT